MSDRKSLCLVLGVPEALSDDDLVTAFDAERKDAGERLEKAQGRVNRQRAAGRMAQLKEFDSLVAGLRSRLIASNMLVRARVALDKGQHAGAGVFLKKLLTIRGDLSDEETLLEIEAFQAEWEAAKPLRPAAPDPVESPAEAGLEIETGTPEVADDVAPVAEAEPLSETPREAAREEAPESPGIAPEEETAEEVEPPVDVPAQVSEAEEAPPPTEPAPEPPPEDEEPPPLPPMPKPKPEPDPLGDAATVVLPPFPSQPTACDALTLRIGDRRLHVVSRSRVQFGRDGRTCEILLRVDHPKGTKEEVLNANRKISRRHFFIESLPSGLTLVDGGMQDGALAPSSGGTYLGGEKVEVESLSPSGGQVLLVSSPVPQEEAAHWELFFPSWKAGGDLALPPALVPGTRAWDGAPPDLWMRRLDLMPEDILLLGSAFPLERVGEEGEGLWIIRHHDGYAIFDEKDNRFLDWESLAPGESIPGHKAILLSRDQFDFADPTVR